MTLQEHSAARVGREWRPEDHAALVHHLAEIDRTAVEMVDRELRQAAGRRLQARENLEREAGE